MCTMTGFINTVANVQLNRYIPLIAFLQGLGIFFVSYRLIMKIHIASNLNKRALPKGTLVATNDSNLPNLAYEGYWLSAPQLPRVMTKKEQKKYFNLLHKLQHLLKKAGVEYVMCDGTLLGSFMAHGFLPWDDDADIMLNIRDIDKVKALFMKKKILQKYDVNVTSYHTNRNEFLQGHRIKTNKALYNQTEGHLKQLEHSGHLFEHRSTTHPNDITTDNAERKQKSIMCSNETRSNCTMSTLKYDADVKPNSYHKFKFYTQSGHRAGNRPWNWPFVDIKYYKDNGSHVTNIDFQSEVFHVARKHFYPLVVRPFGPLWMPAPKDSRIYLRKKYKVFRCHGAAWNHKRERKRKISSVACRNVAKYYPFVVRFGHDNGSFERLKIGRSIIHTVLFKDSYQGIVGPFRL